MTTTVTINDFSGAMVGDDRSIKTNVASVIKHFDPISRPHRMTPYRASANADASSATNLITDFINYSPNVGTNLYGLGQASSNVQIFNKDSLTSGSSWSTFASSTGSASGVPVSGVFVEYKGDAYGGHVADGTIWKCGLNGGGFNNAITTLGAAPTCNGVVHSKDDILYMGASNVVSKNNAGSWTVTALTLPTRYSITALAEFNDFLAIGCNDASSNKSVVFLWDRNSSLTTLAANLDWGTGTLKVLKQVEEYLIGVSTIGGSGLYPKMVFRKYLSGAGGVVFKEIFASAVTSLALVPNSHRVGNRLYFGGMIYIDGTLHSGLFAIQRPAGATEYSVWIDKLPNNDTAVTSIEGALHVNDYVFIAYNTNAMSATSGTATAYSATAYYETTINPSMPIKDRTKNKQLKAVAVSSVPLGVDGGQLVLDYKVDGGAWTTILTQTTVGTVTTERVKDPAGISFTSGREYKFRIKAGGATGDATEPFELKYAYEVLETLI